ncbi:hypothetical protein MTO96_009830 [Rhipicephalus appendiculatus]
MTPRASNGGEKKRERKLQKEQSPEKSLRGRHGQTSASSNVLPARTAAYLLAAACRRVDGSSQGDGRLPRGAPPEHVEQQRAIQRGGCGLSRTGQKSARRSWLL